MSLHLPHIKACTRGVCVCVFLFSLPFLISGMTPMSSSRPQAAQFNLFIFILSFLLTDPFISFVLRCFSFWPFFLITCSPSSSYPPASSPVEAFSVWPSLSSSLPPLLSQLSLILTHYFTPLYFSFPLSVSFFPPPAARQSYFFHFGCFLFTSPSTYNHFLSASHPFHTSIFSFPSSNMVLGIALSFSSKSSCLSLCYTQWLKLNYFNRV